MRKYLLGGNWRGQRQAEVMYRIGRCPKCLRHRRPGRPHRPRPMASELERKLVELEGRMRRCATRRRRSDGLTVDARLSPTRVVSLLESDALPHPEQYRLVGQRLTSSDCVTAAAGLLSTGRLRRSGPHRRHGRRHARCAPIEKRRRTVDRNG
jgi:hypothetical protein